MFEADIAAVWATRGTKMWLQDERQMDKWKLLLTKLAEGWQVPVPALQIIPGETPHITGAGGDGAVITIDKMSMISLLHEFAHHVGMDEDQAKVYSEDVFAACYPQSFAKLERDSRGYLVKVR